MFGHFQNINGEFVQDPIGFKSKEVDRLQGMNDIFLVSSHWLEWLWLSDYSSEWGRALVNNEYDWSKRNVCDFSLDLSTDWSFSFLLTKQSSLISLVLLCRIL